jgi:hypothetical protein
MKECDGDAARFQLAHPPQVPKASAGWSLDHDRRLLLVQSSWHAAYCPVVSMFVSNVTSRCRHEDLVTGPILYAVQPPIIARHRWSLQGILRHGFGRWKPIVDDAQLDLKPQLRLELASKRPLEATLGTAAAAGNLPSADGHANLGEQPAADSTEAGPSTAAEGNADISQVHL